jgi:hypothetical protein
MPRIVTLVALALVLHFIVTSDFFQRPKALDDRVGARR